MDTKEKINELCFMQECIISCAKSEIASGIANVNARGIGEAFDMIKDISQTIKYIRESEYYEKVTEAMDSSYGYTPRMRGNISYGYKPMIDQEPYVNSYIKNPEEFRSDMRDRYGYGETVNDDTYGYGNAYDKYEAAKKWYTKTNSDVYKVEMDNHSKDHLDNTVKTVKEMWHDASPEHRRRIKEQLTDLISDLA